MNSLVLLLLCYNFIHCGIAEQEYLKTTYEYEEVRHLENKETSTMFSNFQDKSSNHDTKKASIDNTKMILQEPTTSTSLSVHQICGVDQFQCNNNLCISQDEKCDGNNDCGDSSDETKCEQKTCSSDSFLCKNGQCIPKQFKCDFERDCSDGSDETDCGHVTCSENEFTCTSGKCIPMHDKCDGRDDCRDGSDETDCRNHTCSKNKFRCTNGQCILIRDKCDGYVDCKDKSDETNCHNHTCSEDEFRCTNGQCIREIRYRCDGDNDCIDGSDEINCELEHNPCKSDEFQCKTAIFDCLPLIWRCDGMEHCDDGSDEIECDSYTCPSSTFSCRPPTNNCIPVSWVCNGLEDCSDGTDEENCTAEISNSSTTTASRNCPFGYFSCDGNCHPLVVLCDGKFDCEYGYDESNCTKDFPKFYQIQHIEVNENGINESNLSLNWWIPSSVSLEFMPSISKVDENIWINKSWINETEYIFTNLDPYTLYNITIYVKVANTSTVFPPAEYIVSLTREGIPSKPYDVKIQQHNSSHVFISWHEPLHPNGKIIKYEISWYPPLPPLKLSLNGNQTAHYLSYEFQPNTTYSFYVSTVADNKYGPTGTCNFGKILCKSTFTIDQFCQPMNCQLQGQLSSC